MRSERGLWAQPLPGCGQAEGTPRVHPSAPSLCLQGRLGSHRGATRPYSQLSFCFLELSFPHLRSEAVKTCLLGAGRTQDNVGKAGTQGPSIHNPYCCLLMC